MKANFKFLVLFVLAMFIAAPLFAQHNEKFKSHAKNSDYQELNLKKRQFMQDSLALTEDEATHFWPVFDNNNQAERDIFKKYQEKMKEIAEPGTKMRQLPDEKFVQMKELKMQRTLEIQQLEIDYLTLLKQILPPDKLARYYRLEQTFRLKMVKQKNAFREQSIDNQQDSDEIPLQHKKRR